MTAILSFEDALKDSEKFKKRHLLLGNGFSIACRPDIFTYATLLSQADFSAAPVLPAIFAALGTQDFEVVIRALEHAARIVDVLKGASSLSKQLTDNAVLLKDILVKTVASQHPDVPNEVGSKKLSRCRSFLSNFLGHDVDGKVYTANYDLLLYWAVMHDDGPFSDRIELEANDGFGRSEETEKEFVDWMGESSAYNQRIHYLHGAVHLFDAGAELKKYTWVNTHVPLLTQAREAMDRGMFPLFVAEGTSHQKLTKIKHSAYLYHSYKSFSAQMQQTGQSLFIFGLALSDNDRHILSKIERGKISSVYVSLYGDPGSSSNKQIITSARKLAAGRPDRHKLDIKFFDAASAHVWS